ncbi:MAG TPA: hypothetical protein VFZ84_05560 [Burkholderiales bacterium]
MDREQDILFFFLTSHGSKEHELSLNHTAMPLRGREPIEAHLQRWWAQLPVSRK